MKKYLLIVCFMGLLFACKKDEAKKIDLASINVQNIEINQKVNSNNGNVPEAFFTSRKYQSSVEDKQCFQDSNGDFFKMSYCSYDSIARIENQIKNKIKRINKDNIYTNAVINSEYKKNRKKILTKKYP